MRAFVDRGTLALCVDVATHAVKRAGGASKAARLLLVIARACATACRRQCPRNPGVFRFFSTLEARISVNLGPIRLFLGPLIISARVLEI